MDGGRYITIFPDDKNRKKRTLFYKLETFGILKLSREKLKDKSSKYNWKLTEKGMKLVENNKELRTLLESKKISEFCEEIISLFGL